MAKTSSPTPSVPNRGDPDRKRVLNLLAQRRYRQRRRERIQALECKASRSEMQTRSRYSQPTPDAGGDHAVVVYDSESSLWTEAPSICDSSRHPAGAATNGSERLSLASGIIDSETLNDLTEFDFNFPGDSIGIRDELQSFETAQFTFPDDVTLEVSELRVLKAGLGIAQMLGCAESIYDFNTLRVFDSATLPLTTLPQNLRPTEVQQRVPHHPLFDILPWPSVRTKFICVFAQPMQMRPPAARDPMALMQVIFDMDDSAEGVRVTGSDMYKEGNWEIGQAFFTNWWWALDRSVVENSNTLRRKRGADKLRLMPPSQF